MKSDDVVIVSGQGTLADAVIQALAPAVKVERDRPSASTPHSLLIEVSDSWRTALDKPAMGGSSAPRIPVWVELGQVLIGPLETPGGEGCATCLDLRRRRARQNPERYDALVAQHGAELRGRRSGWLTGLAASTVGSLVADEHQRLSDQSAVPRTESAVLVVDLGTLAVSRHRFLADPLCPHCGQLPDDGPELADITLAPQAKLGPTTYRGRDLAGESAALREAYVDPYCGMVSSLVSGAYGGVAVSIATLRCRPHDALEPGYGRASTFDGAGLTALLEALERFGGAEAGGRRPSVVASYEQVAEHAVDPRSFGMHPAECYRRPGFAYQPFVTSAPTRWVWGYSFNRDAPVLVPEGAAFWHTHPRADVRPFFFEISNGCALGSSLEEAILHGLLEVIERDAFLMTWYARLSAPRIDLRGASREVRLLSAAIAADTGCEVLAFDTTLAHGVPSVWAMAVHPADLFDTAKAVCAASAHLDPEKAIASALNELGSARATVDESFATDAERARAMLDDPHHVRTMGDHAVLYCANEAFNRFDFLTDSPVVRGVQEMRDSTRGAWQGENLTEDLLDVIDRLRAADLDVIVVDQTTPEHRVAGLRCVKTLVPGTLSMTFGHQHRRIDGIPRLDEALTRTGTRVNPHPHPFP